MTDAISELDEAQVELFTIRPRLLLPYVLGDVNAIRTALAIGEGSLDELPQGVPKDSEHCTLARALSNSWRCEMHGWAFTLSNADPKASIPKTVEILEQLGFVVEDESEDADSYDHTDPYVVVRSTRAMTLFARLYDRNAFPELVLPDQEGL